jgi:molecular chaperone GrpE
VRSVVEKLLPIVDNFDRAMNAVEPGSESSFYNGVVLIARQFDSLLADLGVELINADVGSPFDHNVHHAVAHVQDEEYGTNVVADVLQKGYKHKDKVLRHSMVKVAN